MLLASAALCAGTATWLDTRSPGGGFRSFPLRTRFGRVVAVVAALGMIALLVQLTEVAAAKRVDSSLRVWAGPCLVAAVLALILPVAAVSVSRRLGLALLVAGSPVVRRSSPAACCSSGTTSHWPASVSSASAARCRSCSWWPSAGCAPAIPDRSRRRAGAPARGRSSRCSWWRCPRPQDRPSSSTTTSGPCWSPPCSQPGRQSPLRPGRRRPGRQDSPVHHRHRHEPRGRRPDRARAGLSGY